MKHVAYRKSNDIKVGRHCARTDENNTYYMRGTAAREHNTHMGLGGGRPYASTRAVEMPKTTVIIITTTTKMVTFENGTHDITQ